MISNGETISMAALKAGMDRKTAGKYFHSKQLPSESVVEHTWRTRKDPFADVWDEVRRLIEVNPGLQGDTIFNYLQQKYPGRFQDGQIRTLQRRIKTWRALEGPPKEVFFPQKHFPGRLCASDYCDLGDLGITLGNEPFPHLLFHFVLTFSNWETGNVCFSESFESLSFGLQRALWELGGVPERHRTDSLTAAVRRPGSDDEFTEGYKRLLDHYGLVPEHTHGGNANENGDIEQRHHRFKVALDQTLLLRGSRNFENRLEYDQFLRKLFLQLNSGRKERFKEEKPHLKPLPAQKIDHFKKFKLLVGPGSTIRVQHNTYSVNSRLINEQVEVRLYADYLEIWYAQRKIERMPRLRGSNGAHINYRHIIDWLIRKPGAFANYRYRECLFPTCRFRMAYDELASTNPLTASKEYLKILYLAARVSEQGVDESLRFLLDSDQSLSADEVEKLLYSGRKLPSATDINVIPVDLLSYDNLLEERIMIHA